MRFNSHMLKTCCCLGNIFVCKNTGFDGSNFLLTHVTSLMTIILKNVSVYSDNKQNIL